MDRDELVEAGARAIAEQYTPTADIEDRLREDVGVVVDAVESLIRADERERTNTVGGHRQIREEGRADMCNDLRAKVEALPGAPASGSGWIARDDVLELLGGSNG